MQGLLSFRKTVLLKLYLRAHFNLTSQAVGLLCLWVQKTQTFPKAYSLLGENGVGVV